MIKKILLFPLRIILILAGLLLDLIMKAECWISGIAFTILAICILLAVINQMWLQAGILAGFVLAVVLALFFTANLKIWIDICCDIS